MNNTDNKERCANCGRIEDLNADGYCSDYDCQSANLSEFEADNDDGTDRHGIEI